MPSSLERKPLLKGSVRLKIPQNLHAVLDSTSKIVKEGKRSADMAAERAGEAATGVRASLESGSNFSSCYLRTTLTGLRYVQLGTDSRILFLVCPVL
eukprot:1343750-Amorphochlora_amoeboformis.AAC.1